MHSENSLQTACLTRGRVTQMEREGRLQYEWRWFGGIMTVVVLWGWKSVVMDVRPCV